MDNNPPPMPTFQCQRCGRGFNVPQASLDKYPAWQPKTCLRCRNPGANKAGQPARRNTPPRSPAAASAGSRAESSGEGSMTLEQVLATYTDGPTTGVFTDGAAHPNPGPGGWGAVYVVDDQIIAQGHGSEPLTTNNRMELTALIAGYQLVPAGTAAVVMTDSQLCVDTINSWAATWERRRQPALGRRLLRALRRGGSPLIRRADPEPGAQPSPTFSTKEGSGSRPAPTTASVPAGARRR